MLRHRERRLIWWLDQFGADDGLEQVLVFVRYARARLEAER